MALQVKTSHDVISLMDSAAKTLTGASDAVRLPGMVNAFAFTLNLTNAATDNADTLDVKVQTKIDGTNWVDVAAFTQILGDGANAQRYTMKIVAGAAQAILTTTATLAADAVQHILGDEWRVRWLITDVDVDATFTFGVTAMPM